jgi:hypothetical protein
MVIESPATLARACAAVQADLSDLDAHFAPSIPEEVDLLQVATHVYYKALSTAVRKYVEASPEKSFTREHKVGDGRSRLDARMSIEGTAREFINKCRRSS